MNIDCFMLNKYPSIEKHIGIELSPNIPLCPICGRSILLCICDDDDINDDDDEEYESGIEETEEEYDNFGRNFSDADPGL